MVHEIGVTKARSRWSEVLERVRGGDRVILTRRCARVAMLVPLGLIDRGSVREAIGEIRRLRERTSAHRLSVRALRDSGRKR